MANSSPTLSKVFGAGDIASALNATFLVPHSFGMGRLLVPPWIAVTSGGPERRMLLSLASIVLIHGVMKLIGSLHSLSGLYLSGFSALFAL